MARRRLPETMLRPTRQSELAWGALPSTTLSPPQPLGAASSSASSVGQDGDTTKQLILAAFRKADRNGDGVLSRLELKWIITALMRNSCTEREINDVMCQVDRNGDGKIQYEEFVAWVLGGNRVGEMVLQAEADKAGVAADRRKRDEDRRHSKERDERARALQNKEYKARLDATGPTVDDQRPQTTEEERRQRQRASLGSEKSEADHERDLAERKQSYEARIAETKERRANYKEATLALSLPSPLPRLNSKGGSRITTKLSPGVAEAREDLAANSARNHRSLEEESAEKVREYQARVAQAGAHARVSAHLDPSSEEMRRQAREESSQRRVLEEREVHRRSMAHQARVSKAGPSSLADTKTVSVRGYLDAIGDHRKASPRSAR